MVVRKYPTVNFLPAVLEGWQSAKLRGRVWSKFLLCAGYLCTGKYKFYRAVSRGYRHSPVWFSRIIGCAPMTLVTDDALASMDINNLLRRSVNIIATGLSMDHVLVQDLNAVDANAHFNASIGWDRATSVGLANTLVELLRLPGTDELDDITPDDGQMQGRIHDPSPAFLEKYNLSISL